ncbi:S24/S26 family peptidase [Methanobrevibacter millerae]|uniref:Peptidase S24-like n=1 Tax=Methanobrevibacter millerae TaxID=230361 RepID=A0A1G5V577_9EURY|nr:S24/S26 family peptidase [Methanobrevibacter millerae]SDA41051.1 Peptidase S24-like [Methanobrevibacter millerae]
MANKGVLAIGAVVIILLLVGGYFLFIGESVNVYMDGENITAQTTISPFSGVDTGKLNDEICELTFQNMNNTTGDAKSLKQGILRICLAHGLDNVKVHLNSPLGEDEIPILFHVEGTSMYPTLNDGQTVLVEKTKDIKVGNIVVADSDEYGNIIKRVSQIKGDQVYLTSDNTNVDYEYINGTRYETKGITTWVGINDIYGVVVQY